MIGISIIVEGVVMILNVVLPILFIALLLLILFREKIVSLFRGEVGTEDKKSQGEKSPSVPPQKKQPKTAGREESGQEKRSEDRTAPAKRPAKRPIEKAATDKGPGRAAKTEAPAERKSEKRTEPRRRKPAERVAPERRGTPVERSAPERKPEVATKPEAAAEAAVAAAPEIYPDFDNSRLLEMGLSQQDADAFVTELIEQIDDHIPKIEAALAAGEFEKVERLTHSIKGSATNLGTGGVADQLIAFNTYCKTGRDRKTIETYLGSLKANQEKLREKYA